MGEWILTPLAPRSVIVWQFWESCEYTVLEQVHGPPDATEPSWELIEYGTWYQSTHPAWEIEAVDLYPLVHGHLRSAVVTEHGHWLCLTGWPVSPSGRRRRGAAAGGRLQRGPPAAGVPAAAEHRGTVRPGGAGAAKRPRSPMRPVPASHGHRGMPAADSSAPGASWNSGSTSAATAPGSSGTS